MQVKRWVFTLNNYDDADVARLDALGSNDLVQYLVFGFETGATGTPHLQGFVVFNRTLRLAQAKTHIGDRAHLERALGTNKQASDYCKKDGDYREYKPDYLTENQQGKRTDWDRFKDWVVNDLGRIPTERELASTFSGLFARNERACYKIAAAVLPSPRLVGENAEVRFGWQTQAEGYLNADAHERHVHFFVDAQGNSGKSWFCRYMMSERADDVQVLRIGRREDLAYAVDPSKSIFLFDIPRGQMQFLQYSVLEMLKDRMIFSSKYQSGSKILSSVPHVIVFSNEHPDLTAMSEDRYNVIEI